MLLPAPDISAPVTPTRRGPRRHGIGQVRGSTRSRRVPTLAGNRGARTFTSRPYPPSTGALLRAGEGWRRGRLLRDQAGGGREEGHRREAEQGPPPLDPLSGSAAVGMWQGRVSRPRGICPWPRTLAALERNYPSASRHFSQADCRLTPSATAISAQDWPCCRAVWTAFSSAVSRRPRTSRTSSRARKAASPESACPGVASAFR